MLLTAIAIFDRHSDFSATAVFRHSDFFPATAIFPPWRLSTTANFIPPQRIFATADYSRGGSPPQGEIFPLRSASGRKFSVRHAPLRPGKNSADFVLWFNFHGEGHLQTIIFHLFAFCIKRASSFIQKKNLWLSDKRSCYRDSLLLSSRKLRSLFAAVCLVF